jgi:comEA protein
VRASFLRRALTLAALAVFVAAVAVTLTTPATAEAENRPLASDKVAASKKRAGKNEKQKPRKTPRSGKILVGVLNINTASEDQLQMLPGIGPAKAERVVAYRTKRGKFQRVRDLRRVKGIGYKTVKKLEPHLTVKGPTTLRVGSAGASD